MWERRRQLAVELGLCCAVAALLAILAPAVDTARPDLQVFYLGICGLFGASTAGAVARVLPVFRYRCPRCRERFHGGLERVLREFPGALQACAHCGLEISVLAGPRAGS